MLFYTSNFSMKHLVELTWFLKIEAIIPDRLSWSSIEYLFAAVISHLCTCCPHHHPTPPPALVTGRDTWRSFVDCDCTTSCCAHAVSTPCLYSMYVKSGSKKSQKNKKNLLIGMCNLHGANPQGSCSCERQCHISLTIWENELSCFPEAPQNQTVWKRGKLGFQRHPEKKNTKTISKHK